LKTFPHFACKKRWGGPTGISTLGGGGTRKISKSRERGGRNELVEIGKKQKKFQIGLHGFKDKTPEKSIKGGGGQYLRKKIEKRGRGGGSVKIYDPLPKRGGALKI